MNVTGLNMAEPMLDDIRHRMSFRHFLQEIAWYWVPLDISPDWLSETAWSKLW